MHRNFKLLQISVLANFPVKEEQTIATTTRVTASTGIVWR